MVIEGAVTGILAASYAGNLLERCRREITNRELVQLSAKGQVFAAQINDPTLPIEEREAARNGLKRARNTSAYLRVSNFILGTYNIAAYPAGWVLDRAKQAIGFEKGAKEWWARESTFDRGFKLARMGAFASVAGGVIAATPVAASAATSLLAGELIAGAYKYLTGRRKEKTAGEGRMSLPTTTWQKLTGNVAYLPTVPKHLPEKFTPPQESSIITDNGGAKLTLENPKS